MYFWEKKGNPGSAKTKAAESRSWVCPVCGYRETVSKFKQSPTRFCPKCFADDRKQVRMVKTP